MVVATEDLFFVLALFAFRMLFLVVLVLGTDFKAFVLVSVVVAVVGGFRVLVLDRLGLGVGCGGLVGSVIAMDL